MADQPPVGQQAGAGIIQPQPGPCQVLIATAQLPGGQAAVVLTIVTTSGTTTVFLPPDAIPGIVADLQANARQARTGLLLASGLPPGRGPQQRPRNGR